MSSGTGEQLTEGQFELQDSTEIIGEQKEGAGTILASLDLKFRPLSELFEINEEHNYVVENLLPTGGSSILFAKPKKGKSTLVRQLAVAVSKGTTFLGRGCEQGLVLYFCLEEKVSEVAKHFRLLGATDSDPLLTFSDNRNLSLSGFEQAVTTLKPALVIADTLPKLVSFAKINDYSHVNDRVRWLHDLARDSGSHIMGVMHSNKMKAEDLQDNLLGSTALAGGVDTLISLTDNGKSRTVSSVQRYGEAIPETLLQFDAQAKVISLGLPNEVVVAAARRNEAEALAETVTQFIENNPGCTEREILEGVTGKNEEIKRTLRKLLDGHIRREGKGVAGDAFRYFGDVPIET